MRSDHRQVCSGLSSIFHWEWMVERTAPVGVLSGARMVMVAFVLRFWAHWQCVKKYSRLFRATSTRCYVVPVGHLVLPYLHIGRCGIMKRSSAKTRQVCRLAITFSSPMHQAVNISSVTSVYPSYVRLGKHVHK